MLMRENAGVYWNTAKRLKRGVLKRSDRNFRATRAGILFYPTGPERAAADDDVYAATPQFVFSADVKIDHHEHGESA